MTNTNRPHEDNVIYANFGAKRRVSSAEETVGPLVPPSPRELRERIRETAQRIRNGVGEGPVQSVSHPSVSYSPASSRLREAVAQRTDQGRLKRGREYAAEGRVTGFNVRVNTVEAEVHGSQPEPFFAGFILARRSEEDLVDAMQQLGGGGSAVARAKRGAFPDEVVDTLLFADGDDARFFCDCPDPAPLCKHIVAVTEVAAKRFDADPTLLFALRGLSVEDVEASIREGAEGTARANAAEGSEFFWTGHELPDLPTPKIAPMVDDSDTDLLRRALESVSFTNIDLLNAVADIENLYDALVEEDH